MTLNLPVINLCILFYRYLTHNRTEYLTARNIWVGKIDNGYEKVNEVSIGSDSGIAVDTNFKIQNIPSEFVYCILFNIKALSLTLCKWLQHKVMTCLRYKTIHLYTR